MKRKIITINVEVSNSSLLFSEYNKDVLSPSLKEYINNCLVGENANDYVHIVIKCKSITEKEKELFVKVLRKEYKEMYKDINIEKNHETLKQYIMFFIGMFFITCSYIIDTTVGHVISQISLVFGWVALWEVASGILLSDSSITTRLKRVNQIYDSKIIF